MENLTLTGLLNKAALEFPTRRALSVSGKLDLTHSQLQHLVDHAASLLLASGIHPGDVVALSFPNTIEVHTQFSFLFSFIFPLTKHNKQQLKFYLLLFLGLCSLW